LLSSAEQRQALGHAALNLPQALLVGSLRAQRQETWLGAQGASAPAEADHPLIIGALRLGLHLRALPGKLADVSAELRQVPAGAFGFNAGLGAQHRLLSSVGFILPT
jgi:hypothetical protein